MLTAAPRQSESEDARLAAALREGDEQAFTALVRRHHSLMLRIARGHVRDARVAEEVVHETWMALLDGLERFEGRASLKTWLFRALIKRAITRATRERREALVTGDGDMGPTVDPARFIDGDDTDQRGRWAVPPADWGLLPAARLLSRESLDVVQEAIGRLPDRERDVLVMRDVGGFRPDEVCATLDLSDGSQRVLLHRARGKLRSELERHLA